jgi:hypothetical protein
MPRYSFIWFEESRSNVSFDAAHISSATEYFEDLQNGKIQLEDLPNMKGQWKNGQTEYLYLHEVEIDPDKAYKEGLENG